MELHRKLKRAIGVTVCFAVGSALVTSRVSAQAKTVEIGDQPSCNSCRISLDLIVEFGGDDDPGGIASRWARPFALRNGKWASVDGYDPGAFRFYDVSGRYTHRIEALGKGPGEYQGATDMFRTNDGYLIYDRRQGRLTWVTNDFEYIDSRRFLVPALRMALLPNGDLVYNAVSPASAARGHFVHVADIEGNIIASFGGDGRPIDLRMGDHLLNRIIEVDPSGVIWTSRQDRYELTAYSSSGDTLRVLTRVAEWFKPDAGPPVPELDLLSRPPNPKVVDILSDGDGLLWVLIHVSDDRWQDAVRNLEYLTAVPDENSYWDSVVEVLDPSLGQLLARMRFPEALRKVPAESVEDGPLLYRFTETDLGFSLAGILQARLVR